MAEAENFQIERVLGRTFIIGRNHSLTLLLIGAISCLPALAVDFSVLGDMARIGAVQAAAIAGNLLRYLEDWLLRRAVWMVCAALMAAPITMICRRHQHHEEADIASSVAAGLKQFFPMLVIGTIRLVCVLLGLVLLVAPGFFLMCMWVVVTPARVIEGRKILESFGRSRALTKGHRGRIFLIVLTVYLLELALGYVLRLVAGVDFRVGESAISSGYMVAQWLTQMLFYLFSYILAAAVYYELKFIKEGIAGEDTLAAFD